MLVLVTIQQPQVFARKCPFAPDFARFFLRKDATLQKIWLRQEQKCLFTV